MITKKIDTDIIQSVKNGDIIVFEQLFKSNYKGLCYYAEDIVGEKEAAEEIVSEFFLKLWEKRRILEIKESLQGYIYTSIRNSCIKYLEHLKVLNKYKEYATYKLNYIDLLHPTSFYPLAELITEESLKKINQAIEELPEQCRIIFNMSRFEDNSYEEIANKLGISINTVRTQLSRALHKLREKLKNYFPTISNGLILIICSLWMK